MTEIIEDYRAEYVIDACQYANWNRTIFEQMREGGVTCVNATIAYWENTRETLTRIAEWRRLFAANADLIMPVKTFTDIRRAKGMAGRGLHWRSSIVCRSRRRLTWSRSCMISACVSCS